MWTSRTRIEDENATDELVTSILERLSDAGFSSSHLGADPREYQQREPQATGRSRYVDVNSPQTAATLWISWHENALSPTDPELWFFLNHCASRDRVPLILARAVSRLTFPVLRVLGAKALQYYFIPTVSSSASALIELQSAADLLGLPPVREARTWGRHAVMDTLIGQLSVVATPYSISTARSQALTLAISRRFERRPVSALMLRRWATDLHSQLQISMPEPWKRSLSYWIKRSAVRSTVQKSNNGEEG